LKIRAMRNLLEDASVAPPTFESNRGEDTLTARYAVALLFKRK